MKEATVGTHLAQLMALEWGRSSEKGTVYASMAFRVVDGECESALVPMKFWVTVNTAERFRDALRALGWKSKTPFRALTIGELSNRIKLVCKTETFDITDRQSGEKRKVSRVEGQFIEPLAKANDPLRETELDELFGKFMRATGKSDGGREARGASEAPRDPMTFDPASTAQPDSFGPGDEIPF